MESGTGDSDSSNLDDTSEAAMLLAVQSKDELQLTVTKTCLDVFTKLGAVRKNEELIVLCTSVVCVTPDLKVHFHFCRHLKRLLRWKTQEWLLWWMFHPFRYGMRFVITD